MVKDFLCISILFPTYDKRYLIFNIYHQVFIRIYIHPKNADIALSCSKIQSISLRNLMLNYEFLKILTL